MNLKVNYILPRSRANGPGLRYVIWVQGCSIHCLGCSNKDTWDFDAGQDMDTDKLAEEILKQKDLDGVTITGGEPMDQRAAVFCLCAKLFGKISIFLTTGYTWVEEMPHSPIFKTVDILCTGPFEADKVCSGQWKGSWNQELLYLTDLGREQSKMPVILKEIIISPGQVMETGFTQ